MSVDTIRAAVAVGSLLVLGVAVIFFVIVIGVIVHAHISKRIILLFFRPLVRYNVYNVYNSLVRRYEVMAIFLGKN